MSEGYSIGDYHTYRSRAIFRALHRVRDPLSLRDLSNRDLWTVLLGSEPAGQALEGFSDGRLAPLLELEIRDIAGILPGLGQGLAVKIAVVYELADRINLELTSS